MGTIEGEVCVLGGDAFQQREKRWSVKSALMSKPDVRLQPKSVCTSAVKELEVADVSC
jgi:hypothetical protein